MKNTSPNLLAHAATVAISLLFLIFSGCATRGSGIWPAYYRESIVDETGKEARHREILYPFLEMQSSPSRRYVALRPLANVESKPDEGLWKMQFLWPLGLVSFRDDRSRLYRFWPFFQHSYTADVVSGEGATHGMIFPFVFWGHKPERGNYAALLPIGGRTYGLLGDEFSWVLFPFYSYYERSDYRRHDLLWPFFSSGGTPDGQKRTVRFWPVYVLKEDEDSFIHNYLIWPFLRWGNERWETVAGEPMRRDYFAFHPFYARLEMRDGDGEVITRQRSLLFYNRFYDIRWDEGQTRWSAFFSLIRRQATDDTNEWRFFPFFWKRVNSPPAPGEKDRSVVHHRLFWPLIWHTRDASLPGKKRSYAVFAPFLWHYRTHHAKEDVTEKSTTFWPAVTFEHGPEGKFAFYLLSHGWRDSEGGYKRNYRPFFEIFRFRALPDGSRETRLLWRLYHHKRGPEGRELSVPVLFSYDTSVCEEGEPERRTLSFFFGLIEYEVSEDGRRVRFFGRQEQENRR